MVGFGGGSTGSSGLQWLVWIQLLVTILLILLLYCFSLYASEIGDSEVRVSLSSRVNNNPNVDTESTTSFFHSPFKVVGSSSIRGEISTPGVGRRIVRSQNGTEGDAASAKDVTSNHSFTETHPHHPCSFLKLAREAFLKCLGLDCMAEDSRSRKQSKTD